MKNTKWLIGALVLMNLILLTVLFSFKPKASHSERGEKKFFLTKKLDLSEEQKVKFKDLHEAFVKDVREEYKSIREMKKEIIEVISAENPDTIKAQNIAAEIGRKEVAKEQMMINHYLALQAECTPEQRLKLKSAFQERMSRSEKKWKERKKRRDSK